MSKKKPKIKIDIYEITKNKRQWWDIFKKYHYLSNSFNIAARVFICLCNDEIAGFCAALPFPHPKLKNTKKEHRTVILPDYQGVGIGTAFTNAIADYFNGQGYKYISTTSNPAMIATRAKSKKWVCTHIGRKSTGSSSGKIQNKNKKGSTSAKRITVSFRYIGNE